ncbi:hypothetical protein ANCCAN_22430 [Ancylostoma caninum]|uniref:Uncharacterized protein n=1 Tax=Ancylostoma caninum TaxID=29170 RepID=A0A368FI99_ANCCA|nr:hypothetical protein ANCCAN_22430 [Ancylostoma caninum]
MGASIKDIFHERAWIATDVFSVRVKVVAETRDRQHVAELEEMLRSKYDDVSTSFFIFISFFWVLSHSYDFYYISNRPR